MTIPEQGQPAATMQLKQVTFFRVLWAYIYNYLETLLYVFLPTAFAGLVLIVKPGFLTLQDPSKSLEGVTSQPAVEIYMLILGLLTAFIFVTLLARDFNKHFVVNDQIYKKIFYYVLVLEVIFLLANFSISRFIDRALELGLFYWVMRKWVSQGLPPPGYQYLRGKNRTILLFSLLIISALIFYFGTPS